jgi:hypothetical protein
MTGRFPSSNFFPILESTIHTIMCIACNCNFLKGVSDLACQRREIYCIHIYIHRIDPPRESFVLNQIKNTRRGGND